MGVVLTGLILLVSCIDDSHLALQPPIPNQSFVEDFDTLMSAYSRGWRLVNRSQPIGPTNWNQIGDPQFGLNFKPYSSTGGVGYVETDNFSIAPGTGVASNWLISPTKVLQNGDRIVFYASSNYGLNGVRLQVRINANNTSLDAGQGTHPGSFDKLLLDINPNYQLSPPLGFPADWTKYEATITGLDKPANGRFAFRYFHENAIADDPANGVYDCLGIDSVAYISIK